MQNSIPKTYDKNRESEIYARWETAGYFRADAKSDKPPYTIVIPPPNITAKLHMGHAFNNTIQDILIRFKRMQGFEALWMPGTDHAAIATEVIVMKALAQEGITKDQLGREGFLQKLWEWNEIYGGTIITQLKSMGCSCDWDRTRFTMDEGLSDAVLEVFVRLYNEGKIYRGERLVNWCVKCGTSISDAEVEHEDREDLIYHFKYPVVGTNEFISFATTRPETMLGDTAVAVAPGDERYTGLVGKYALVPFGPFGPGETGREIPIIADEYVDPAFGTGVVKITPAHDPNDFEVGLRHNLPRINILHDDGRINENGGASYAGLTREEAREKITEDMKTRGLFVKTAPLAHSVGGHDRCGTTVEPLMKLQWFVKMDELAASAVDAYESGRLKFNRERFGKIYMNWL
ncbi:MAG: class I tRNA ligase family protein, partial [Defluviitaleaceae bacterium]|nr:class I tRNA ligase family protein [Defluviitaleaceae bacterium]